MILRRNLKIAFLTFIISTLFAASATVAFAALASSDWRNYGPHQGYYYMNQAQVYTDSGVMAWTKVAEEDWDSVPAGYMAAWAGLYNSSGQIKASSGNWIYNSSSTPSLSVSSTRYYSSGAYYSKGMTAAYNGSGYNTYDTYMSPSLNY
jgi:hypothetical protein